MNDGFQRTLDHIRAIAESEAHKGRLFERLMKTYFTKDPIYRERFSAVWLWSEWASPTSRLRRHRYGGRSGCRGTRRQGLLRHSVQVLRPWHANLEAPARFVHRRLGARTVHDPYRCGHRRRMGDDRP